MRGVKEGYPCRVRGPVTRQRSENRESSPPPPPPSRICSGPAPMWVSGVPYQDRSKRQNVDSRKAAISERESLGVKFSKKREVGVGEGEVGQNSRGMVDGKKVVQVDPPIPNRCV